ncbi:hypothetical protein GCM10011581_17330 [Saccharopolyspora subtropica]|uniref:Glycosyltransferase n=1 Tax=Saccharopolyspora thermophila TaxID=89367 RepID=A0A917JPW2_9PSEU|nr:hypothetical protein [Saccharopolyspora subtropica]GGI80581.1 hypothetical protein GCM10011581_17330 [Saccharopolyspora subtropica]
MKVIASAEAFGYGPASKLHAICSEIGRNGGASHFFGHDVALTFAQSNSDTYASITPVDSMSDLAAVSPDDFDAAISVMDPFLVAWAAYHRLPCVYVDSLYWFWDWSGISETEMGRTAEAITGAASANQALRVMADVPMHPSQYLAHHLCTTACVQLAPGASARAEALRGHPNVRTVDPVIDLGHRAPAQPDSWLVTTSGLLSPVVSIDLAVSWIQSACELVDEAARLIGADEPMVVTGNPEVLAHVAPLLPARFEVVALNHEGVLKSLNHAIACLTPPGLTTILEAAAYGTPVVFLPEQHYAHLANYQLVSPDSGRPRYAEALLNTRIDRSADGDISVETKSLIAQLAAHRTERTAAWSAMVRSLADGMADAREHRSRVAAAQNDLIRALFGGHSGAEEVRRTLESVVNTVGVVG